ncbi:MAG: flavin reductase [Reyranella sp.]|nr:flavin reductase [Reyranella sp.]
MTAPVASSNTATTKTINIIEAAGLPFDSRALRDVLGAFVTGVTVITALDEAGTPYGLTANSFSSVSLDPPLVLWSQALTAPSHPVFRAADRFAINILACDQVEISNRFARAADRKFEGVPVRVGLGGLPLLEGCAAYLECRKITSYPGGDHAVFLGQVERIERTERPPLVFGGGRYLVAQPHDLGAFSIDLGIASLARVHAVRLASAAVAQLAAELDETVGLGVWGNQGPTIVRWEPARRPVSPNLRTGLVLPVCTSATGICFAAHLPPELTDGLIRRELLATPEMCSIFDAAVEAARWAGVVRLVATRDFSDMYGVSIDALSVPVFDQTGTIALALTAIGHAGQLDVDPNGRLVSALARCAEGLSAQLGHVQPDHNGGQR